MMHHTPHSSHPLRQKFVGSIGLALLVGGSVVFSGCGSLSLTSNRSVPGDPVAVRSQSPISNIMGPTERSLKNRGYGAETAGTDADLDAARVELQNAKKLYDAGEHVAAEKAFKAIIKQRREKYETFGTKVREFWGVPDYASQNIYDNFGDPVEEDAIFLLGESQFAQQRYTRAQDSYDDLLNRYPSTRHMDRVTRQMFRIARYWLGFPNDLEKKETKSEIQLASKEEEEVNVSAGQASSSWDIPLVPNFTDKTRPVYDADGRGLQALRSIWLHDATGPLADDALMLAANHNLRIRNFVEAKRLYELLRDQYPDSPHLQDAYLLGSHVTLASYEGPRYDGNALDKARDLKQTMLQIFPEMNEKDRRMLEKEINEMHFAEIDRLWGQVEYYQTKGIPEATALHCNVIINRYPNSPHAEKARAALREIQGKSQQEGRSLWAWGNGQKPAAATPPKNSAASDPRMRTEKAEPEAEPAKEKSRVFGFLRRTNEPPKLEAPPTSSETPGRVEL